MLTYQEFIVAVDIGLIYGLLALGIYITFRVINIPDLTCDGSFVLGAATSAVLLKLGYPAWFSFAAAIIAGGLAGGITGIFHLYFKMEDLLSGIITAFMLYSINLRIMNLRSSISLVNEITVLDSSSNNLWVLVLLFGLILAIFLNSDAGLGVRTLGQNRSFAAAQGINVSRMLFLGLVLSNAFIGACGSLFSQYQRLCDVSQGTGSLVMGLASVMIGEKLLKPWLRLDRWVQSQSFKSFIRQFLTVGSCVAGSIVYRVLIALALHSDSLGLKTQDLNLMTGCLMIFVMRRKK